MVAQSRLAWDELFELSGVELVARVLGRRFSLGLGYADARTGEVKPPRVHRSGAANVCGVVQAREAGERACRQAGRAALDALRARNRARRPVATPAVATCPAGLTEIAAPIVVAGECVGALLCGGLVRVADGADATAALEAVDARIAHLALAPGSYAAARGRILGLDGRSADLVTDLVAEAAAAIAAHLAASAALARPSTARGDLESPYTTRYSYDAIIGRSQPLQDLYALLDRVVATDSTVLIQGENGTGKELVARAVHYNSARKNRRFVVQNCSAFNDNLLDSELFGHRRGAFTGAIADKQGLFEVADQGTFFLDEIGDMSPALQVKVLRVLQEGTFTPVGGTDLRQVDVRIIAATNRDLKAMVARGEFREDLYYRINVINLVIPPLRERRGDIELLCEHFLERHAKGARRRKRLSKACIGRMLAYRWPGNVRELENEIERLVVLSGDEREIGPELLSPRIGRSSGDDDEPVEDPRNLPAAVRALERRMITEALQRNGWNKTRAALELSISRRNLIRLAQKYELTRTE